jgi:hypothetical protein
MHFVLSRAQAPHVPRAHVGPQYRTASSSIARRVQAGFIRYFALHCDYLEFKPMNPTGAHRKSSIVRRMQPRFIRFHALCDYLELKPVYSTIAHSNSSIARRVQTRFICFHALHYDYVELKPMYPTLVAHQLERQQLCANLIYVEGFMQGTLFKLCQRFIYQMYAC